MKITKKIFNKILFAVIVALVFSFINRCSVKALDGTSLSYTTSTITYEQQVNQDCWYKFGDTFGAYGGTGYDFYLCSTNKKVVGYKLSGTANLLSDLTVISFDSYFDYTNVFLHSYSGSNNNTWFLILSEGDLPTLGGSCTSGSYCFNVINSGSQGNGRSATAKSNTILFTNNITYINGSATFIRRYYTTNEYFGTATPSINLPDGSCSSNSYRTYSTSYIYNAGDNVYSCNLNRFELQTPVPPINYNIDFVTINSSDNSQEDYGNDLTITGVATAIKYSPCDKELYNYYYGFIENSNDDIDWVQVNDNKCIGSYVANKNGYLLAKIEDKNGGFLYSKTFNIRNIGTISTFAVNNNKFSTFLTDISSNINYGGPISGLTTIPINLMSTLYNSFNGTCSAYNLGSILGHNVIINCFTLESILGSSITGVIDMLCAFGIYYHLVLLIISIYRKVMNLDDLDDYLPQHMYHPQHGSYEDLHS